MLKDAVKERLRDLIVRNGRSMRQISMAAGLGPSYLSGLLNEDKEPTHDRLLRICAALRVDLDSVIYGTEDSETREEIVRLLRRMSPAQRQTLLELLRTFASESDN